MARSYANRPPRPRAVWCALAAGILAGTAIVAGVFAPIIGLIAASAGAAWFIPVPTARITLVALLGFTITLILLILITRTRTPAVAWTLAALAALAALTTSLYPAITVATDASGSISNAIPWITSWIDKARNLLP